LVSSLVLHSLKLHVGACVLLRAGDEAGREVQSVDDFVAIKQAELIRRAYAVGLAISESKSLETRQWDFKSGVRNCLFEPTSEEERVVIIGANKVSTEICSELNKDLRAIRSFREQTGCSCKALKIDKLSVAKLKDTLVANGHHIGMSNKEQIDQLGKADLVANVKEALKFCTMCIESKCECFLLNVPCSADACGCLRHGPPLPGHHQSCGNPYGSTIFNPQVVGEYRKNILRETNGLADRCGDDLIRTPGVLVKPRASSV
jgi:hypothetical protein